MGPETLEMGFYRMGIYVGDLDKLAGKRGGDYIVFEKALKHAFLWWDIEDYTVQDVPGGVVLSTGGRELTLAAKTYLPVRQEIKLEKAYVTITYSDYRPVEGLWYPHMMRIDYSRNSLDLRIKQMELTLQR